ncbi:DNA-deoxyinosine glycosylase [Bacillaceae bacterium Marseille-Q3522]|nr:DNA-deoxyinosine glycosylase [Bacillaceae bacterium Marseille-Q3522]
MKIYSLDPVSESNARVLILGSIPGRESLAKQQYYAHPRNQFWKIIFAIFQENDVKDYQERLSFLKKNGIALWDVIHSCEREGSLDSSIKKEEPNDIAGFLSLHPHIRLIACNGGKAFQTFQKYIDHSALKDVKIIRLPSTSPVPGKYIKTLEEKIVGWQQIIN